MPAVAETMLWLMAAAFGMVTAGAIWAAVESWWYYDYSTLEGATVGVLVWGVLCAITLALAMGQ